MGRLGRRRLAAIVGAAGLAAVLATAGCGSGGTRDNASSGGGAPAAADKAGPGGAEAQPGQPAGGAKADLRVDQRAIIYTGSMTVRVDDVGRKAAEATSMVTAAGGFVGADKRTSDASSAEASLELRVPAAKFADVVDRLAGLGTQERRDINTQDVTEETLDLDARIATQQARVDSGRRLLGQAKTLSDLIMLEGELAKREADLASLEAKKRRLADLTALSTITVVLLGPTAKVADDKPQTGFVAGLKGGWKAFVVSMEILLTVLGALLPWLIAFGVPVVVVLWLVRRLRRRTPPLAAVAPHVPASAATGPLPPSATTVAPAPRAAAEPGRPSDRENGVD